MTLEEKIQKMNVLPFVREQIQEALEAEGIVEDAKLDAILLALKSALEIVKAADGTYKVSLVTNGKVLRHDDETKWSVDDFVRDYVFLDSLPAGVTGIPYEQSMSLSNEDLLAVADGKKIILPPKRGRSPRSAIPSSDGRSMSQNIDDIASGKKIVDTDR